tara:strand:- start:395 stop:901 length:507 start_codon:yes stop_codon:yes gene_type:complete
MIIDGLKTIPMAIHYIDESIDLGDIILEDTFTRERGDDYFSLTQKHALLSQKMLLEAIRLIDSGNVVRKVQDRDKVRYIKRRTPEDSKIDWGKTSYEIHNFISALVSPMPNAFCFDNKSKVAISKSNIGDSFGMVIGQLNDFTYVVSTGDGVILVETSDKIQVGDILN